MDNYGYIPLVIGMILATGLAFLNKRRADNYQTYLDSLRKKSQVEQELSLATMDQILAELGERASAFIMILPAPQQDIFMSSVYIKGFSNHTAILYMQAACAVINSGQPSRENYK